jgi:ABC-type transporter MlaC component
MKKTLLAVASISVAAFAYANTSSDSSELVSQQCKISAEAVSTLKSLRYGNTSIRKDVAGLIKDAAQMTLNRMVDDQVNSASALEAKYCS